MSRKGAVHVRPTSGELRSRVPSASVWGVPREIRKGGQGQKGEEGQGGEGEEGEGIQAESGEGEEREEGEGWEREEGEEIQAWEGEGFPDRELRQQLGFLR